MTYGVDPNPKAPSILPKPPGCGRYCRSASKMHGISRERQDAFAVRSHRLAEQARINGGFDNEIVAIEGHNLTVSKYLLNR